MLSEGATDNNFLTYAYHFSANVILLYGISFVTVCKIII